MHEMGIKLLVEELTMKEIQAGDLQRANEQRRAAYCEWQARQLRTTIEELKRLEAEQHV